MASYSSHRVAFRRGDRPVSRRGLLQHRHKSSRRCRALLCSSETQLTSLMVSWSELTVAIILVYIGFYVFIVFLSLSIATGLYYLAGELRP